MSDSPSLGSGLLRWFVLTVLFLIFGGIGAGLTALAYEWIAGNQFSDALYAILFAACGYIAYRELRSIVFSEGN